MFDVEQPMRGIANMFEYICCDQQVIATRKFRDIAERYILLPMRLQLDGDEALIDFHTSIKYKDTKLASQTNETTAKIS